MPLDELQNFMTKLNKEKPVYIICQSGRRSQTASEQLKEKGFNDIYNIQGGTTAWEEAELPIEK